MSIPLPNLYIKKYKDISNEMLESIPKYTDKWTNHNPSDPGITILEMLAWIGETILYRIDRIPEETYISFLRLVAGAADLEDVKELLKDSDLDSSHRHVLELLKEVECGKEKSVEEIKASVLIFLNSHYRAVTEEDFRKLSIEATAETANLGNSSPKVKRAIVSARSRKVEIVVVPDVWVEYEGLPETEKEAKYEALIKKVYDYLYPRRLIGTIVEVKKPVFTPIKISIKIVSSTHVKFETVEEDVKSRIKNYLDPLTGGPEGKGWPYGRLLTVYEISQVVEETEGVERTCSILFDDEDLNEKKNGGLIKVVDELAVDEVKEEECR